MAERTDRLWVEGLGLGDAKDDGRKLANCAGAHVLALPVACRVGSVGGGLLVKAWVGMLGWGTLGDRDGDGDGDSDSDKLEPERHTETETKTETETETVIN